MTLPGRLKRALADPVYAAYQLRAKHLPGGMMRRYARMAQAQSCRSLYFVLSFDCDTVDDIAVAWDLHSRLLDIGIMPVYAVPGQLLQKGEPVYRRILETGAEFINHGFVEHTYFNIAKGRHVSCFFYDQQTPEVVTKDILSADACLREVLGVQAEGFRTPHFGTYQQPDHLAHLHGLLRQMKYRFSTSTSPYYGFRNGPLAPVDGLVEIPVSGMGTSPLTILDSWACFAAPDRRMSGNDYLREAELAAGNYRRGGVGVLNYYADPYHVADREEFIRAVQVWKTIAQPVTYHELLENVNVVQSHRTV